MHKDAAKWDGWAQLLAALVARALEEDQVLGQALGEERELLAYPVAGQDLVLVGLGLSAARAEHLDLAALLRRRGREMERSGHWLPARFEDGSLFLLRRWPGRPDQAWPGGAALALRHAEELLDE
ncbi:hypothetical protein ACFOHT_05705 [Massilia oculi]|uniref:Uncharacterized protein n=1 Tax=Massilia oculi TaxID=945844 RepID=A0A2S2DF96_9BURK|nr:hypothetical protein [Massilia oculi]AWL03536.1 hypothetical protein DIR46_03120 [Massilia oculi]